LTHIPLKRVLFFVLLQSVKLKKALIIILLLFGIGISNDYLAQSGGKKRERRNQRRGSAIFRGAKSAGNADKFARGTGRRGLFARLFKKENPSWHNKTSGSVRSHRRDNRALFTRYRSKGRRSNDQIQARQNSERAKKRVRGNKTFSRKKY